MPTDDDYLHGHFLRGEDLSDSDVAAWFASEENGYFN